MLRRILKYERSLRKRAAFRKVNLETELSL